MRVKLVREQDLKLVATNDRKQPLRFDAHLKSGGEESAPVPMEGLLSSLCACTSMDVLSILRKKRREIVAYEVEAEGTQAETHPRIFTKIHLRFQLVSPDATLLDFERSIELSQDKYCPIAATLRNAGCELTWEAEVLPK